MSPTKTKAKPSTSKRRSVQPSAPEVQIGFKTAGRETLAAIEEELQAPSLIAAEAPLIEISEAPAGRDTLAAIEEELAESMTRPRQNTLPYGDRISNAPGARAPSRAPKPPVDDAPQITVAPEPPPPRPKPIADRIEIFELLTFIVRGNKLGDHTTDALRRRFVEQNLLHRVPSGSMDTVERIEVTPWTAKGTMVVRVWVRS